MKMKQDMETIYLLDGSSYIHRAYHAIRNLQNAKGFPTNAIFGFTKMILKLLSDKKPDRLAIVFDAKGPTTSHAPGHGGAASLHLERGEKSRNHHAARVGLRSG
jgi:5'-3' exonuclease